MKITKTYLKRVIKEETAKVLREQSRYFSDEEIVITGIPGQSVCDRVFLDSWIRDNTSALKKINVGPVRTGVSTQGYSIFLDVVRATAGKAPDIKRLARNLRKGYSDKETAEWSHPTPMAGIFRYVKACLANFETWNPARIKRAAQAKCGEE